MGDAKPSRIPKGLPKRTRNERKKATRHRSWLRGQERKRKRREEQAAREVANKAREAGEGDAA